MLTSLKFHDAGDKKKKFLRVVMIKLLYKIMKVSQLKAIIWE
jgi:hypothetical protein